MRYRVPAKVGRVVTDDSAYLMVLPNGAPRALNGTAALIWMSAAAGEDAVAEMTQTFGDPDVAAQTAQFLAELVELGFLEEAL